MSFKIALFVEGFGTIGANIWFDFIMGS